MHLYPSRVRRALQKLMARDMDISRLSKTHAQALLEHGVHGALPGSLYDMAMSINVQMVAFFHPSVVRVHDLLRAINDAKAVHPPLLDAARYHKHELLRRSDGTVLQRIMESDVVTSEDAYFLVRCRNVPPATMLSANPALASVSLDLSDSEIDAVFSSVPCEHWQTLYSKLDLSLQTVLRLAREYGVPPTHLSLLQLQDPNMCLALVMRFPEYPVLQFVAPHIKYRRDFSRNVDLFVSKSLPAMYPHINSFLSRALPLRYLVEKYRVKAYAMFDNACHSLLRVDVRKLSSEDARFVEENIGVYDVKARDFALRFRQHVQRTQNRTITMFVPDTLPHAWRQKRSSSVEDLLQHIDAITDSRMSRPRTKDLHDALEPHRYDMSLPRRVLLSDASARTKRKALKAICKWKVSFGIGAQMTRASRCALVWNTYAHVTAKIFRIQSTLMGVLCTPEPRQLTIAQSPLQDLRNRNGGESPQEVTDDSLLVATRDLAVLASKGIVDTCLVPAEAGWGVIMGMLDYGSRVDHHRFRGVLTKESLRKANISARGVRNVMSMSHIQHVNLYDMMRYERVLRFGEPYVRAMLYFDILFQYLIAIVAYRVVAMGSTRRVREFVSKVVNCMLEAFGIRFSDLRVPSGVEHEIFECFHQSSLPFYTLILFARAITEILEHLNGTS